MLLKKTNESIDKLRRAKKGTCIRLYVQVFFFLFYIKKTDHA